MIWFVVTDASVTVDVIGDVSFGSSLAVVIGCVGGSTKAAASTFGFDTGYKARSLR
jgi:hypothetical protein